MTRKLIIDCSPGIDDTLALAVALFDAQFEVVAVTATEGNVPAQLANVNVQAVIETLDPPRLPRIGTAVPLENRPHVDFRRINGDDGLGNVGLVVARLHQEHPSEKIIGDEVRTAPEQVTVLCLGPLTNLARAFQRDPDLDRLVHRVVIAGGTIDGIGDVTPAAELNMYFDPISARTVFRSPIAKTLVPLDVARKVPLTLDLLNQLPDESTASGRLIRHIVPALFRAYRQNCGLEHILLHRTVATVVAAHPEWFDTREMAGDVEPDGELTTGATVFDRRHAAVWRNNMEVVVDVHEAVVRDHIIRALRQLH